ncbi:MAG: CpaF family protein [Nesterenkonia sp.]
MSEPTSEHTAPTDLPIFSAPQSRPAARSLAGNNAPAPQAPPPSNEAPATPTTPEPTAPPAEPATSATAPGGVAPEQIPAASSVSEKIVQDLAVASYNAWNDNKPGGATFHDPLDAHKHGKTMRQHITNQVREYTHQEANNGHIVHYNTATELERAVYDNLFGLGPIQKLLDLEGLRNLEIIGHDTTWLTFGDGRVEQGPPVAESDHSLLEMVKHFARTTGTEKEWSAAAPHLRMALPDGSRLAADAWVTHRPQVRVRKHAFIGADLEELRRVGMFPTGVGEFLRACMNGGLNIIVSGVPGTGKTTISRAVLRTLPRLTSIATIEAMYELGLHRDPENHPRVWAAESRPPGESGGEITLTELFQRSLQVNADRFVIGEVTGPEAGPMLQAMQGGRGSISTVHAENGWDTVERLVTLLMLGHSNFDTNVATRLVAQNVDVIVHLDIVTLPSGRPMPVVDEILTISRNDDPQAATAATRDYLWRRDEDGRGHATGARPEWLNRLTAQGFDPGWLEPHADDWPSLKQMDEALREGGAA